MSYQDRYGVTPIRKDKYYNLTISWDFEDDEANKLQRHPVFLFTPDMSNVDEHHHIELSTREAKELYLWLADYLEDVG